MPDQDKPKTSASEQARKQKAAAERTLAIQAEKEGRDRGSHIDSMATNPVHQGRALHDKPKSPEMSALKTDQGDITGDPHVRRTPLKTPGKGTTDLVTVSPEEGQPQGGAPAGPGIADRAAAAAKSAKGKKGKKRRSKAATQ